MPVIPIALAFLWLRMQSVHAKWTVEPKWTSTVTGTSTVNGTGTLRPSTAPDNTTVTPEEPSLHERCFKRKPHTFEFLGISYELYQLWWNESQVNLCFSPNSSKPIVDKFYIAALNETSFIVPHIHRCDRLYTTIHGYESSQKSDYMVDLKKGLLRYHRNESVESGRCNMVTCVLLLDWKRGASRTSLFYPYFPQAVNTKPVGANLALLLLKLRQLNKIELRETHLIGFSLGAQVAHMAAEKLRSERAGDNVTSDDWHLKRITGLDPAACCFSGTTYCLNDTDATYVDIVHTTLSTKPCDLAETLDSKLGVSDPIGHSDFYLADAVTYCKGDYCSHNFAVRVFTDSLDSSLSLKLFHAIPCEYNPLKNMTVLGCDERWMNTTLSPEGDAVFGIHALPHPRHRTFYALYPGKAWLDSDGQCHLDRDKRLRPEKCVEWEGKKGKW